MNSCAYDLQDLDVTGGIVYQSRVTKLNSVKRITDDESNPLLSLVAVKRKVGHGCKLRKPQIAKEKCSIIHAFGSNMCENLTCAKIYTEICLTSMCNSHCTDEDCKTHGEKAREKAKEQKKKFAHK